MIQPEQGEKQRDRERGEDGKVGGFGPHEGARHSMGLVPRTLKGLVAFGQRQYVIGFITQRSPSVASMGSRDCWGWERMLG